MQRRSGFPCRPRQPVIHLPRMFVAGLFALCITPLYASAADVTFDSLMEEMLDRARLAEFPDPPYTCRQFSSYDCASTGPDDPDTWFANRDAGNFLRVEENDGRQESVMMDIDGPGAVVRIWSANAKGTIRFYLDGAERPTIAMPMQRMLGGEPPIGEPLSGVRSRGWNCYLPIPYAKRCKITCDDPDGLYYQINYRTYEDSVAVASFDSALFEEKSQLIASVNERLADPQGHYASSVPIPDRIDLDEELELFAADGPGAITELRIRIRALDVVLTLRNLLLVGEFDGQVTVHCPLGDFFGTAPGANPYQSLPITIDPNGMMICRWFMPYAESARLRLVNVGDQMVGLDGIIGYGEYEWNDRSMHFYAVWRGSGPIGTRPMRDFNYATIEGRGVWVGDALHIANPVVGWWGEGDEKIYVDGESFPSHFGTGTEDYYGYAWCTPDLFTAPLHNQTRCDGPRNFGHTSLNRFRGLDAIPFTRSLQVDIEVWHWTDTVMHYAVTDYFYGRDAEHNVSPITDPTLLAIPQVKLNIFRREGAIEAEDLDVLNAATAPERAIQTMGDGSPDSWSNMEHVWCKATQPGQRVVFGAPVKQAGEYEVIVYFTRSWDYGVLQCYVDGRPAGQPIDTFNVEHPESVSPPVGYSLGRHHLVRVGFSLTVEVVGSNEKSKGTGCYWGLDCIVLKKVE